VDGCGAGVSPAVARASCPCAGAGRSRDRGRDARATIFRATRSIGRLRVSGLWNRRAHDCRPVQVCAQKDRAALLPPDFSTPALLDALPNRHFDPLHIFYCFFRLTSLGTCDSLLWWSFCGHIVVGERRDGRMGKEKRDGPGHSRGSGFTKTKNSTNEASMLLKTNDGILKRTQNEL
jgi:hypothetical protein